MDLCGRKRKSKEKKEFFCSVTKENIINYFAVSKIISRSLLASITKKLKKRIRLLFFAWVYSLQFIQVEWLGAHWLHEEKSPYIPSAAPKMKKHKYD